MWVSFHTKITSYTKTSVIQSCLTGDSGRGVGSV